MTNILAEAFRFSQTTLTHIGQAYDKAGLTLTRFAVDHSFLDIDLTEITIPVFRQAAEIYNKTLDTGQMKLYDQVSKMVASGDLTPKPDFKKPLLNLGLSVGKMMITYLPRMNISQAAVMSLGVATVLVAAHLASQHTHTLAPSPDLRGEVSPSGP